MSLLSFFDSLWIKSDIEKQEVIKQSYFKIFKEPELRDENYIRKWFFEHTKDEKPIKKLSKNITRKDKVRFTTNKK